MNPDSIPDSYAQYCSGTHPTVPLYLSDTNLFTLSVTYFSYIIQAALPNSAGPSLWAKTLFCPNPRSIGFSFDDRQGSEAYKGVTLDGPNGLRRTQFPISDHILWRGALRLDDQSRAAVLHDGQSFTMIVINAIRTYQPPFPL